MELEIKITGSGKRLEIINGLKRLTRALDQLTSEEMEDFSMEDQTIYTEIKSLETYDTKD